MTGIYSRAIVFMLCLLIVLTVLNVLLAGRGAMEDLADGVFVSVLVLVFLRETERK